MLETGLTSSCFDFCELSLNAVIDLVFTLLTQQINEFKWALQMRNWCSVSLPCGRTHPMVSSALSSHIWQRRGTKQLGGVNWSH